MSANTTQIIKLSQIAPNTDNIFNVSQANLYQVVCWGFQPGHSVLFLKIGRTDQFDSEDTFYVCLEDVEYFEGTVRWIGANFCIGSLDACKILLQKMEKYRGFPSDFLPGHLRLLIVATTGFEIRIVAGKAILTNDLSMWNTHE